MSLDTRIATRHPIDPDLATFRGSVADYYLAALADFRGECGSFSGLRVLEIGGSSLPKSLVMDVLGVRQWVCVDILHHINGSYQMKSNPDHYSDIGIRKLDNEQDWKSEQYLIFDGDAVFLPKSFSDYFDVVFTVNSFEHVLDITGMLKSIAGALKPGGRLFSQFGPLWSGSNGSHFWISSEFNFMKPDPLESWDHLLHEPKSLNDKLIAAGFDEDLRKQLIFNIYESRGINRLHFEDYSAALSSSDFSSFSIQCLWRTQPDADTQILLEKLFPNYKNFSSTVARIISIL